MVRIIKRSQLSNFYENIRPCCPCQFKVQIATGINHNKGRECPLMASDIRVGKGVENSPQNGTL